MSTYLYAKYFYLKWRERWRNSTSTS